MTVLGLGAAAVAISVSNASAMEQAQTTSDINVRQDPSATSGKVSELKAGVNVKVTETKDGWTKIKTEDGKSGWVSGYYVSDENSANKNVSQSTDADSNTETNQNVQDANKAETVNNNNTVNASTNENVNKTNTAKKNVVSNAAASNENADVSKYVKESNKEAAQTNKVVSNGQIKMTGALNVRVGPSTANGVSSVIHKGDSFKVIERASNGWLKVVLNDGTVGWASGKYIDLTSTVSENNVASYSKTSEKSVENTAKTETVNAVSTVTASNSNQGKVNSAVGLNVRSGAGTNSSVVTTLTNDSVVNILGEENGWYKVRLDNGSIGYVGASYITKTNNAPVSNIKESAGNSTAANQNDSVAQNSEATVSEGQSTTDSGKKVVDLAQSLLGIKYSWGGTTTSGFDCSGFTQYVYKNALGISIPRVSRDQARAGSAVSLKSAKAGDLLYFDTMGGGRTSHVGIYLGDGKFIHASGSAARPEHVKISKLSERWVNCLGARRFA